MQNQRRPFVCKRCGAYIDTRRRRSDGSLQCPECKMIYRPRPTQSQALQPQVQITKRQPPRMKKQWSKKKILVLAALLLLLFIFMGSCGNGNKDKVESNMHLEAAQQVYSATTQPTQAPTQRPTQVPTQSPTKIPTPVDTTTLGERNALASAKSYLNFTAFSYIGLGKQLMYEGYTKEEAKYAVDNCGADWYEQAAKSAKSYLEYTSFSRQGLIDQLEYEEFTHDQALYGVKQAGY